MVRLRRRFPPRKAAPGPYKIVAQLPQAHCFVDGAVERLTAAFYAVLPDDGGKDVFVHATALERAGMRNLVEGQKISFDIEQDSRSGKCGTRKTIELNRTAGEHGDDSDSANDSIEGS
jgi:cold shock protein